MLIVGAGGLAAQLFDELLALKAQDIVFWSEEETKYQCIKENFKIINTDEEVVDYFNNNSTAFVTGIWDIMNRKRLTEKFLNLGGELTTYMSPFHYLSSYTTVGNGSIIMHKASSESGVSIGENCIINKRANFGHGCSISAYCSIGPYSIVASDVEIGENCYVGMGAIIQPKVKIGNNVVLSAGAVVTKNIPDNAVLAGVPAKIRFIKK